MEMNATLARIARRLERPFWLYDAATIRHQISKLRQFDTIRFAQKANSNTHILRLMREEGVLVDAVSLGEIERALAAGFEPGGNDSPIVFTADLIDRATLKRVIELGIPVNCGSLDMLDQVGKASPGHRVWIRINPGFGHGHSNKTNTGGIWSKHGIWHEQIADAARLVRQHGLRLKGLHMHIGSGVDYRHLQRVCEAMISQTKALGLPIEAISAGGGLSTPYRPGDPTVDTDHYFSLWNDARKEVERVVDGPVRLEVEPGRYLVAQSGYLVAEVYCVKAIQNHHFVLVDIGFNDLMRPVMYGAYHEMQFVRRDSGALVNSPSAPIAVAGPLCEAGDVFMQSDHGAVQLRDLPLPSVGDLLVVRDAGAYGAAMSSNYNTRPLTHELLIDNGRVDVIREVQDLQQLLDLEKTRRVLE